MHSFSHSVLLVVLLRSIVLFPPGSCLNLEVLRARFSVADFCWSSLWTISIAMLPPGFCLHIEGVADAGQLTLWYRKEKTVSPLFVRGRPVSKIQNDSGLAPKCDTPAENSPSQLSDYVH